MTDFQKKQLESAIIRLEHKISSYSRTAERVRLQAFNDSEAGYEGSYQFNKGQQFVLEYVIEDLQIVLQSFKEVSGDE